MAQVNDQFQPRGEINPLRNACESEKKSNCRNAVWAVLVPIFAGGIVLAMTLPFILEPFNTTTTTTTTTTTKTTTTTTTTPLDEDWAYCATCEEIVDKWNQTVGGFKYSGCFQDGSEFLQKCSNQNDTCVTYLSAYYDIENNYNYGGMIFDVYRECTNIQEDEQCYSINDVVQFKICNAVCDPLIDGIGCNNGLKDVSEKFEEGKNVQSCYQCNSVYGPLTEVTCANNQNSTSYITDCPRYANGACFSANTLMVSQNVWIGKYESGCSPFFNAYEEPCYQSSNYPIDEYFCQDMCTTDNCNIEPW